MSKKTVETENQKRKTSRYKKSKSGKRLTRKMKNYYADMHMSAMEGDFVVWIALVIPTEIFRGFENIVVCVPESHSAMCAGKGTGVPIAEIAEGMGFSMDLCSYARIGLGSFTEEGKKLSPTMGLPKPDLLVSNSNNCNLLVKWFDVLHRMHDIPHAVIDVPFCIEEQMEKDRLYIKEQFEGLIAKIEDMTNQKYNYDKMKEAVNETNKEVTSWKKYLSLAKNRPSGITAFDTFVQMALFVNNRGTRVATRHYDLLAKETIQRVEEGIFPVPTEKYRLLWDNIAPWHQLFKMSSRLRKLNANIVHATYTSCIGSLEGGFTQYEYKGEDPLEYLARIQNFSVCPYGLKLRVQAISQIIENIGIDGIVFASNRSCKVYSTMQMDLMRIISEKYDIPTVMIDVDHADIRKYNEENSFLRVEALLERIEEKRNNS